MLLAGDEVLRTQRGNNNAYAQDNELSWFDWQLAETNRDMLRFTRELIALRRRHRGLTVNRFFDGRPVPGRGIPDIAWHGVRLDAPPWQDAQSRVLRFTIAGLGSGEEDLHVMLNMSEQEVELALPSIPGRRWHVALDTTRTSPLDIVPAEQQKPHPNPFYASQPRSVAVLEARI
jgi:glycogen operon protein